MKQRPKNAPTCVLRWCDVGLKWSWADVQQGLQIYHSTILATATTALIHQFSNYYFTFFLVVSSKFQGPVSRGLTKSNGGEWIHCFVWWEPVSQRLMSGDTTCLLSRVRIRVRIYLERSDLNEEQLHHCTSTAPGAFFFRPCELRRLRALFAPATSPRLQLSSHLP